jgi:uncharacterized protein (UPF0332 family)
VPRIQNPYVGDLLELAVLLAAQRGRSSLVQASLRRAVSTAYYALFHALCTICSDGLVRWSRTELVDRTYRSLDHGTARRKLSALATRAAKGDVVKRVSIVFAELQDSRNDADYERPRVLFTRSAVAAEIAKAQEAVDLLGSLSEGERRSLAIELLVAKPR